MLSKSISKRLAIMRKGEDKIGQPNFENQGKPNKSALEAFEELEEMIDLAKLQWTNEKWDQSRFTFNEAVRLAQRLLSAIT